MGHEVTPDEDDVSLDFGRAVHDTYYRRTRREVPMEGAKIDVLKLKKGVICEVKTSSRYLQATKMQTAYYLYRLREEGVNAKGEILVPRERRRVPVELSDELERELLETFRGIARILDGPTPPSPVRKPYCRRCSYRDFCWI